VREAFFFPNTQQNLSESLGDIQATILDTTMNY
jgi:hypothetical protein